MAVGVDEAKRATVSGNNQDSKRELAHAHERDRDIQRERKSAPPGPCPSFPHPPPLPAVDTHLLDDLVDVVVDSTVLLAEPDHVLQPLVYPEVYPRVRPPVGLCGGCGARTTGHVHGESTVKSKREKSQKKNRNKV